MSALDDLAKAVREIKKIGKIEPIKVTPQQYDQLRADVRIIPYVDNEGMISKFHGIKIEVDYGKDK